MPAPGLRHRPAVRTDAGAVAALTHAHYGGDLDGWVERVSGALACGERVLLAEEVSTGRVVGYAKSGRRVPSGPDDPAPAGTWLTGAVVDEAHRRRGVARHLLGLLVAGPGPSGEPVWSMTDAGNQASLGLHAALGFVEVLRAPRMLGEGFRSGEGVLLRLDPG